MLLLGKCLNPEILLLQLFGYCTCCARLEILVQTVTTVSILLFPYMITLLIREQGCVAFLEKVFIFARDNTSISFLSV